MENVLKRFIRWILGWYVEPIRNQCTQAVSELRDQQTALQEKLRDCKIEVTQEQQQQLDTLRELQKQIEQQRLRMHTDICLIENRRTGILLKEIP